MSISSRITQMEQHIGNAYDKIEDLGIDLTDVDKNINNISAMLENVWDEYPKVSATDVEEASINGTKTGRMEIDLKGQTSQATTILPLEYQQVEYIQSSGVEYINSGYQLNSNTSKIIIKSKTINGLNKFRCLFGYENGYINRFFLRFSTDNSSSLYAPNNYTINNMQIDKINNIEIDISNNKTKCNGIETATSIKINNSSLPLFIFTLNYQGSPASDNFSTMQLYTFQVYENNNIVRNLIPCYRKSDNVIGLYDTITNIFLTNAGTGTFLKGSDVSVPNPDFPQPIKNVTGNVNVKIQNKNLFTGDYSQFNSTGGEGTLYDYFKLPENDKVYTISVIAKNDFTPTRTTYLGFSGNGGDANLGTRWVIAGTSTSTITKGTKISINNLDNEKNLRYVSMYTKGATNLKNFTDNFEIQIEQGSTATSYVPHAEQNLPFTFAEGQRGMQGTTLEDDGIYNERKHYVYTGNETLTMSGYTTLTSFVCYMVLQDVKSNANEGKCNIGNVDNVGRINSYSNGFFYNTSGTAVFLKIQKSAIPNWDETLTDNEKVDLVKAFLAQRYANNNPVEVEYELAEEEIIPYNSTQQAQYNAIKQARSYDDITYITSTSDELGFNMDVESLANANKVIDSLDTRLLALESEV